MVIEGWDHGWAEWLGISGTSTTDIPSSLSYILYTVSCMDTRELCSENRHKPAWVTKTIKGRAEFKRHSLVGGVTSNGEGLLRGSKAKGGTVHCRDMSRSGNFLEQ